MNNMHPEAAESLALINRMIENTRNRLSRNSGRPFLIWGYTTVAVSLFNYVVNVTGGPVGWSWSWFLIPVVGFLLTRLFPAKKSTEPRTEIDRIVSAVWATASLALIPVFAFVLFHGLSYRASLFGLIALIMAIATTATGRIVRSKIYIVSGYAGLILTLLFPLYDRYLKELPAGRVDATMLNFEILIFAGVFIIMMIVPGHIFNHRSHRHVQ